MPGSQVKADLRSLSPVMYNGLPQIVCTARELCATTGSQCTAFHTQMAFGWWVQTL